jgi:hypothetical protein
MSPSAPPSDRSTDPSSDRSRRGVLRAGAGLVGAVGLAGCVIAAEPYTETVERSFDPGDAEELAVRTDSGDVTLSAGDGDAVSGTVRKESRSGEDALDEVTVDSSGDRRIEGTLGSDPEHALELRSTNGDVTLLGL